MQGFLNAAEVFLTQWSAAIWGVIGGGAGVWALIKFLPEKTVGHLFDARLERVKGEIRRDVDADLEGIRHELGRDATRRDLQFAEVYGRQLETLESIFAALSELQARTLAFTTPYEIGSMPTLEERAVQLGESYDLLVKTYYPRRIWLDEETQKQIEDYLLLVRTAVLERRRAERQPRGRDDDPMAHWDKSWNAANEQGEEMRKAIERRFREVLGVLDIHLEAR